jgi:fimbrial chaperone protein
MKHCVSRLGVAAALIPACALAGSLRVGPTRIDLSPPHPVAVLEIENTGESSTLTQLDSFSWTQTKSNDVLEPTSELITTPIVLTLAPGETKRVRVGLRDPNRTTVEHSYRVVVREVAPDFVAGTGLRFALRISVPVFAASGSMPAETPRAPDQLSWARSLSGSPQSLGDSSSALHATLSCATIVVANNSAHHERLMHAELRSAAGETLWESSRPEYVLAQSRRSLPSEQCVPKSTLASTLRLTTDTGTVVLPAEDTTLLVDGRQN